MTNQRTPDPIADRSTPGQGRDDADREPDAVPEEIDLDEDSDLGETDDLTGVGRSDIQDDEARKNR